MTGPFAAFLPVDLWGQCHSQAPVIQRLGAWLQCPWGCSFFASSLATPLSPVFRHLCAHAHMCTQCIHT